VNLSPLWLARPGGSPDVQNGDPAPLGSFSNPYGPWDPSGTASPKPWSFWQYGTSSVPGMEIGTDLDVAHGDLNYVSSFLIPTVTWKGNGANNNWSNNANWNPNQPLNHDTVVFGSSPQTNIRADFSSYPDTDPQRFNQPALHLESVTFAAGAPSRSIELYTSAETSTFYQANLTFDGAGVSNSSAVEQTFVVDKGSLRALAGGQYTGVDGSTLTFNNSASAGTNVTYEAKGGLTTFFFEPGRNYPIPSPVCGLDHFQ